MLSWTSRGLNCWKTMCIRFATMLKSEIISFSTSSLLELLYGCEYSELSFFFSIPVRVPGYKSAVTLKVNVEPTPTFVSKTISPSSRLQIFLQIERPRPTPLGFRWALNLSVQNSENMRETSYSGMPVPVSFTETYSMPFSKFFSSSSLRISFSVPITTQAVTKIMPSWVNLQALERRFMQTCWIRYLSAIIVFWGTFIWIYMFLLAAYISITRTTSVTVCLMSHLTGFVVNVPR